MTVHIPPVLVLIVCKVAFAGAPDQNADITGAQNLEWATVNSMMTCRRNEVQLYDPVDGMTLHPGDDPAPPLTPNFALGSQCARAGIQLATSWDQANRNTPWRVWRVGCPAPIVDTQTGMIIGYKLPECSHRDTVVCEVDSAI
jgi:hypothetical protein